LSASTESQLGANKAAEQVKKAENRVRKLKKPHFACLATKVAAGAKRRGAIPRTAQARRRGASRVVSTVGWIITASEGEVSAIKAKKGRTIIKIPQKIIVTY
jgi:hypothetical protein